MPTLNEITHLEIARLNETQLTTLLRKLLSCEAAKHQIPFSAMTVAFVLEAPDGGEDGRAEWQGAVEKTDWLPSRYTSFQCKATDMFPADCKTEVLNTLRTDLVPQVKAVMEAGGDYVLFYGRSCNQSMCTARVTSIREALTDLARPYAATAKITVYSAEKIATWCNQHLACVAYVLENTGMALPLGLKTWSGWSTLPENQTPYIRTALLSANITQIQRAVGEPRAVFRIQGLSGLGKSRMVFEAFRPEQGNLVLSQASSQLIYLDGSTQVQEIAPFVNDIHNRQLEGIIVVDNCPLSVHTRISSEVRRTGSQLKLITIDFASDEIDPEIPTIKLDPKFLEDVVKQLLLTAFPELNEADRGRIEHFAQGFPRLAVLLAQSRLRGDPTVGRLNDADLLNRLLWGHDEKDANALKVLEACSIFTHLGTLGQVEREYRFVAEQICHLSPAEFYSLLQPFKDRGLCQQAGDFIQITPKPLAIRLAADWWRKYPPGEVPKLLAGMADTGLATALCDQMAYLDFLPEAREITKGLCGEQGPFGQAEVLMTKEGSRLFRSVVEVNPQAAAKAVQRVFGNIGHEKLHELAGNERRHLVNAFEKLCFWEDTFELAAPVLLKFAASETETWANNATGLFKQLFHLFLSGTQANLKARIRLAQSELASGDIQKHLIVVGGLGQALESNFFSRMGGVEKQGSRVALTDYQPTRQEIREYWTDSLEILGSLGQRDGELAASAREAMSDHLRGLVSQGQLKLVQKAVETVLQAGISWPAAASALRDSLRYEGPKFTDSQRTEIQAMIDRLAPKTLTEKLRVIVSLPDWDTEQRGDKYVDVSAEKAVALADEIVASRESILPYLDPIFTGEQRQGFNFGHRLGEKGYDAAAFIPAALDTLRKTPKDKRSVMVLAGVLASQADRTVVDSTLEQVAKDDALVGTLIDLTRLTKPTLGALERVLSVVEAKRIPLELMRAFAMGSVTDSLTSDEVKWLARTLQEQHGIEGASVGFQIVYMYCLHNPDHQRECADYLREVVSREHILGQVNKYSLGLGHPWESTVSAFLKGKGDVELAEKIATEMIWACSLQELHFNSDFFLKPVLILLFNEYQEVVWPKVGGALLSGNWLLIHHLSDLLGDPHDKEVGAWLIASLPLPLIQAWCREHGAPAAKQLAALTPVLVKHEDKLSWHPLARMLIDEHGSEKTVLDGLTTNIGTYSWTGSAIPYYQQQIALMRELMEHPFQQVRDWAKLHIEWFEAMIARDQKHEEQESIGVYDRT